jgi:hypothetical protein
MSATQFVLPSPFEEECNIDEGPSFLLSVNSSSELENDFDPILSEFLTLFPSSSNEGHENEVGDVAAKKITSTSLTIHHPASASPSYSVHNIQTMKVPNPLETAMDVEGGKEKFFLRNAISVKFLNKGSSPLLAITTNNFVPLAPKNGVIVSRSNSICGSTNSITSESVSNPSTTSAQDTSTCLPSSYVSDDNVHSSCPHPVDDENDEAYRKERNRLHAHKSRIRRKNLTHDLHEAITTLQEENSLLRKFISQKLCNTKKVEDHQVESSTEQVHRTIY